MARTKRQAEADQIDMEMHRLAGRMEAFADECGSGDVRAAAMALLAARRHVRQHMSETDREATKWA